MTPKYGYKLPTKPQDLKDQKEIEYLLACDVRIFQVFRTVSPKFDKYYLKLQTAATDSKGVPSAEELS